MKTAIIYYSHHHGNTKKLLDAIAQEAEVTLLDVAEAGSVDLSEFQRVGFASGIYYSKFHKTLRAFAREKLPQGMPTFLLYTYGAVKEGYTQAIRQAVAERGSQVLGEYGCFGFNTFGPFKLIGGIAKGHPDQTELQAAVDFYKSL